MKHPHVKQLSSEMDQFYTGIQQCNFHLNASFSANLGSQQYWFQQDPHPRQVIHGDKIREGDNLLSKHFLTHQFVYTVRADIGICSIASPTTLLGCLSGNMPPVPLLWEETVREFGLSIPILSYEKWTNDICNSEIERYLQKSDVICIPYVGVLVVGGSFGQVLYRLQLIERLSNMMIIVKQIGKGTVLTPFQANSLIPNGRRASSPNHKSEDMYTSQQTNQSDDWERW